MNGGSMNIEELVRGDIAFRRALYYTKRAIMSLGDNKRITRCIQTLDKELAFMDNYERVATGLGEECGVFGAYDMDGGDVASSIYYGLFALQHRGQESCGIAVTDTYGERKMHSRKGLGLVNEVFDEEKSSVIDWKSWDWTCPLFNGQEPVRQRMRMPLVINYVKGTLGLAHNGNLTNAD